MNSICDINPLWIRWKQNYLTKISLLSHLASSWSANFSRRIRIGKVENAKAKKKGKSRQPNSKTVSRNLGQKITVSVFGEFSEASKMMCKFLEERNSWRCSSIKEDRKVKSKHCFSLKNFSTKIFLSDN